MKQQNESEKKLKVRKDYVNLIYSKFIVIDRVGKFDNKGFYEDLYKKDIPCTNYGDWREATEEEVIEAFEKHLNHRFGEDWRTMKIKEKHPDSIRGINGSSYEMLILKLRHNGWVVYNQNGMLYCNGIWVERMEEEKELEKIHIKEAIKEKTVIHCETEEEAERILEMADELGYTWESGRCYIDNTRWESKKIKTCYNLPDGLYGDYNYFKNNHYNIIPSTQIADVEEKKSDKKRYEVIKTDFSDFKQLSLGDNKTNKIIAHFVEQGEETALLAEKIADILNLIEK